MEDEPVGTVTHYFPKPQVGVVKLDAAVRVGDVLQFHGHTTNFQQKITSLEIEHVHVESAESGAEVAIKLDERVREGDKVYRVVPG